MLNSVQSAVLVAGLLAVSGLVTGASAQAELAGTWKLNPEKSHPPNEWMHFTPADNGAIRYTERAKTFTFKTDGTPVPPSVPTGIYELRYSKESETHYTEVSFLKGKVISTKTLEVSPDNRWLSVIIRQREGSTNHAWRMSYERDGTGQGLIGDWRPVGETGYRITDNGDGSITFETIAWKDPAKPEFIARSQVLLRTDGTYAAPTGPNAIPNMTMALARTKDGSYQMLKQISGKPAGQSLLTLSFDGKSMTESMGADDPKADVAVYDKQ